MAASLVVDAADGAAALQEFREAKAGVKGLVDSGITAIPSIFHQLNLGPSRPPPSTIAIPIVDFSLPRSALIDSLRSACRNPGFFQLINHDIPPSAINDTISAFKSFYELPGDVRSKHFSYDKSSSVTYSSNVDIFGSSAAWVDSLRIHMSPVPPDTDLIPEVCRKELLAWDVQVKKMAAKVTALLSEGLGVAPTRLEEDLKGLEKRHIVANYYPTCPEPERTIGFKEHTDTSLVTVLVQDQIGGLQVKMMDSDGEEYWVDVNPLPGALVVNVGDLFQILSNDEYKSGPHRVLANPHKEARVAIVTFFSPVTNEVLGPLPELISKENPPKYKNFNMVEYFDVFFNDFNQKSGPKLFTEHFKLSACEN